MKLKQFASSLFKVCICSFAILFGHRSVDGANITWIGTNVNPPVTEDLTNSNNWSTASVPTSADTAQFQNNGATTGTAPFTTNFASPFQVGEITFLDTTSFTISNSNTAPIELTGAGINNQSTSTQTFDIMSPFTFSNSASADVGGTGTIVLNVDTFLGGLTFLNTSTASQATINATAGSFVNFNNASAASQADITLTNSSLTFLNSSTGGSADVTANGTSTVTINQNNTLGSLTTGANATVDLNAFRLTVGSTNTGTDTIAGQITGAGGSLVKVGTGTLILTGANNYTGGTSVTAGTLQGNSTSLQGNIIDNAALVFNQTVNGTYAGTISGTGTVTKTGAGTLILTGPNIYSGGTTISAGTLQGNTTSLQGNILDNAALIFDQTVNGTYAGTISGTGTLTKIGAGTLILTGPNSYSGGTTITTGTLQGNTTSLQGNILDNAALVFDQTSNGTYSGTISGTGTVTKIGAATLILTGPNTYSGGTTITAGTLQGDSTSLQGNILDNAALVFNQTVNGTYSGTISGTGTLTKIGAATLILTGPNTYSGGTTITAGTLQGDTTSLQGDILDNAALVFNQTTDGIYSGTISGTGTLTKIGTAKLTLTGPNSYSGGTTITAGTLQGDTTSLQGDILDNAALIFNQTTDGTYSGVISGTGTLTKIGAAKLILTGANSYSGGTTITAGTLQGDTTSLQGDILDNAALIFNQTTDGTYSGVISGTGTLTKIGAAKLILTGANSYSGGTTITAGTLQGDTTSLQGDILDNAALIFNQTTDGTYSSVVSGTGTLTKIGAAKLILTGPNTYSGGTTVTAGTLEGNTTSLQGNIVDNANLIFNQVVDGTYSGIISGNGTIEKRGIGTLTFTGNSGLFSGSNAILAGKLIENGILGGLTTVYTNATLTGTGTLGSVVVNGGGTIFPGNGIGTLNVLNNFHSAVGARYNVSIGPVQTSSLLNVGGTAGLAGGTVNVISLSNPFSINSKYTILTAAGGVFGQFQGVNAPPNLFLTSDLAYDFNHVYLIFQSHFSDFTKTKNQQAVANQLDNVSDPSADLELVLSSLITLTPKQLQKALDQMSGEQYTSLLQACQLTNHRFIKGLYDPLRRYLTNTDCECFCQENEFWLQVTGGRGLLERNENARGYSAYNAGFNIGFQHTVSRSWTYGFALNYDNNHIDYALGGTGNVNTVQGAFYGAFHRPDYYFLTDFIVGYNGWRVKRQIKFAEINRFARSEPSVVEGVFYGETGLTFDLCSTIIQPFFGVESGYYNRNHFREFKAKSLNLSIKQQTATTVDTLIGLHLTKSSSDGFMLSADIAWQYRFLWASRHVRNRFREFGDSFSIVGIDQKRDSLDATIYAEKNFTDNLSAYTEFSGELGTRYYSMWLTFGISNSW